ncbi:hypothetical protein CASFOL_030142 [Castilleja foliolosa]|uniref:F-box domain-containing protein n=1 Tax=Castilleja foliolosa TaxID=1961234 RepID=A0ABD3C9S2_9LAMI
MLKKKKRLGDSVDRLSTLPDDTLCHILSFLPTKISVSTSTLSKRWRSIWAHVPTLDFNPEDYADVMVGIPYIISRVMSLHKAQTLDALRLISLPDYNDFELETVVLIAMSRNVKNIHFELNSCTLPRHLFTITTLVRLEIPGSRIYYKTGGNVHLPCLKWLHLGRLQFQVDEDLPGLLSGCPVLEELILNSVSFAEKKSGCFNVSSSSLKRLTVNRVGRIYDSDHGLDCSVEINAPALIYLNASLASRSISVSPMTSLVEANIDIYRRAMNHEDDNYISMVKFLDCLCHVKCLTLGGSYNEKFVDMALAAPFIMFDNLKKLVYQPCGDWHLLGKLLKVANNLEVLIVSNFSRSGSKDINRCWDWEEQVPACVSSHLKTIRISGMTEVETEQNCNVRYLLENAKVLEKLEIITQWHSGSPTEQMTKLVEFLSSIVRGSEACELVVRRSLYCICA